MSKRHDFLIFAQKAPLDDLPDCPGVYLFTVDWSAVYVGQTDNIRRRMTEHKWMSHIPLLKALIKDKTRTRTLFVFEQEDCNRSTGLFGRDALRAIESEIVLQIEPSLNERKCSLSYAKAQFEREVLLSRSNCAIGVWTTKVANRGMV